MFRKTEVEKANILGPRLVGAATETATLILERLQALDEDHGMQFNVDMEANDFVIELMVFFMHLVDRLAFGILGAAGRLVFADRFMVAIMKEVLSELSKGISADNFGNALRRTYNMRQREYAKCKILVPEEGQALKDTLYWEFSKILFGYLDDDNPATLMFLNILVSEFASIFVIKAAHVEEILLS